MLGVVLGESTDEGSQPWKSEVEMKEEEKRGTAVFGGGQPQKQWKRWKALGASSCGKKTLLDGVSFVLP